MLRLSHVLMYVTCSVFADALYGCLPAKVFFVLLGVDEYMSLCFFQFDGVYGFPLELSSFFWMCVFPMRSTVCNISMFFMIFDLILLEKL